jgi:hypothetical protein
MFFLFYRTREEEGWDDNSYTNDANPFGDPNLTATFRYALQLNPVIMDVIHLKMLFKVSILDNL